MSCSAAILVLLALCMSSERVLAGSDITIGDRTFSHTWLTKTSMPAARSDMTATTVGDKIFLIGGCIMDQQWTAHPAYPGYVCGSGLASAVSGLTSAYLPLTNEYQTNLSNAPRARYRHAAAAVGTKIYLFGGSGAVDNIVAEVDVLDTATGAWETLPYAMPDATTDLAAFSHGSLIYVVGGYTAGWEAVTKTHVFNPALSGSSAWTQGPSLKQGRGDTFATVIGDTAFIIGGFHHGNDFAFPLNEVERLDIGVNSATWAVRQQMDVARGDKAVASLHDVVHVIGGETKSEDGHSQPLRDVEVYDPETNKWFPGGDIPSDRFRFTAAAHGESIFIFGGQGYLVGDYGTQGSKYPVLDTVEEYSESVKQGETDVSAAAGTCLISSLWAWAAGAATAAAATAAA